MIKNLDMEAVIQRSYLSGFFQAVKTNIYELDLAIWHVLRKLAKKEPSLAVEQFQIKLETAQQIAQAEEDKFSKLASEVLFSFRLCTAESDIIHFLKSVDYADLPQMSASNAELYTQYWLAIHRVAGCNRNIAHFCFGISQELAKTLAQASEAQIRRLANSKPLQFSLRSAEQPILDYFSNKNIVDALIKKQMTILKNTWYDRIR